MEITHHFSCIAVISTVSVKRWTALFDITIFMSAALGSVVPKATLLLSDIGENPPQTLVCLSLGLLPLELKLFYMNGENKTVVFKEQSGDPSIWTLSTVLFARTTISGPKCKIYCHS